MASIVITIDTDGAAFHDTRSHADDRATWMTEVPRILHLLATEFNQRAACDVILPRDSNGKGCGKVEVIDATKGGVA